MERLFKTFSDYHRKTNFLNFQNEFSKQIYESLEEAYIKNLKEPDMVNALCEVVNGKIYENMNFYSEFIHGNYNSGVSFYNKNENKTKELADMVIISIATENDYAVFEKIAFIQNKKETKNGSNKWEIEQNQLYLLQNFPNFTDNTGKIMKMAKKQEVIFSNYSETLGNYGLFQSSGEMILINALNVFKLQQKNKISFDDIKKYTFNHNKHNYGYNYMIGDEMINRYFKYYPEYFFPSFNFPFLNNAPISYNIYDFVRNWTLFNIGEVVISHYRPLNKDLVAFSRALINKMSKNHNIESLFLKTINNNHNELDERYYNKFENFNNILVLLCITDLSKEKQYNQ